MYGLAGRFRHPTIGKTINSVTTAKVCVGGLFYAAGGNRFAHGAVSPVRP
jgi:hypothetical protein